MVAGRRNGHERELDEAVAYALAVYRTLVELDELPPRTNLAERYLAKLKAHGRAVPGGLAPRVEVELDEWGDPKR